MRDEQIKRLIRLTKAGPWKNIDEVELATLEWVDWFNNRRILEPIGNIPPAELRTDVLSATGSVMRSSMTHTKQSPIFPG